MNVPLKKYARVLLVVTSAAVLGAATAPDAGASASSSYCEQDKCVSNKCQDATSQNKGCDMTSAFTCKTYDCDET